jgi:hypothetical protein
MEEIQAEDGGSASPGEQRFFAGKRDGFVVPCCWRPISDGEKSR